jgi:hypothetical protein
MNRFRKLGFISYNGRIQVDKSLLNVILLDQLPDRNAANPVLPRVPPTRPRRTSDSRIGMPRRHDTKLTRPSGSGNLA